MALTNARVDKYPIEPVMRKKAQDTTNMYAKYTKAAVVVEKSSDTM